MLQVSDRTDAQRAWAIRERLRNPKNARIDQGIALQHPHGVTGWERQRIAHEEAQEQIRAKEQERVDPLARKLETVESGPICRDWLVVEPTKDRENKFPPYFFDFIFRIVIDNFQLRGSDIIGPRRSVKIAIPRHIIVYFSRQFTTLSFPQIMRKLGNRDHTCGVNSIKRINNLIKSDPQVADNVSKIERILEQKIIEWRAHIGE